MKAMNEKAFFDALDRFERSQKKTRQATPVDVCATYALVKPILASLLMILQWIPGWGPRVVVAIKALMAGLDAYCANPSR